MIRSHRREQPDEPQIDHSGYVDIHCHILPGLDDGAQTLEESLELAREAVANGLSDIIATPHLNRDLFPFSLDACQKTLLKLKETFRQMDIPLNLHLGAEVKANPDIAQELKTGIIPTLAGSKYLLLELPFDVIAPFTKELIFQIQLTDVTPILAHPERNMRIQDNPGLVEKFIEAGCLLQINSTSVTGHLGRDSQMAAIALLKNNWAHIIASDAHIAGGRGPNFKEAVAMASKYVGVEKAKELVCENPAKVLPESHEK